MTTQSPTEALRKALETASKALTASLPYMQCNETGEGPDCSTHMQAMIDVTAALRGLASQPLEPVQWQPIETAPKDRHVLGVVMGEARLIRWGKTSHVPMYGFCLADQGPEDFDICNPTHWMPLPEPPAAPSAREATQTGDGA